MQETPVQPLGPEDALEKEMATHSCILAWKILWTEEPGGLQSMGSQRVGYDRATTHTHTHTHTHTGHMCSALIGTAKQFSKVVVPILILRAVLESLN